MAAVMTSRPALALWQSQAEADAANLTWLSYDRERWYLYSQVDGETCMLLRTLHDWYVPRMHERHEDGSSGPGLRLLIVKKIDVARAMDELIGSEEFIAVDHLADDLTLDQVGALMHRHPDTVAERFRECKAKVIRSTWPYRYCGPRPPTG